MIIIKLKIAFHFSVHSFFPSKIKMQFQSPIFLPFLAFLLFIPLIFPSPIFAHLPPMPDRQNYLSPLSCFKQFYAGVWKKFRCPLGNDFCYVASECSTEKYGKNHDHRGCTTSKFVDAAKAAQQQNQTNANCAVLGLSFCQECRFCKEDYCNGAMGNGPGWGLILGLGMAIWTIGAMKMK